MQEGKSLHDMEYEAIRNTLSGAAFYWAAMDEHDRTPDNDPLRTYLPETKMPTALQFEAVYQLTGKTEADRRDRDTPFFTPETESAWCRSMLKRWVVQQHKTSKGWFHHGTDREGLSDDTSFDPPKGAA